MKFGIRKSSWKKSFKARTTGKAKRKLKKALIPGYGKKGRGLLHPKKQFIIKFIIKLHLVFGIYLKGNKYNYHTY